MKIMEKNLDGIKKSIIENDYDWLHVVEGYEGSGKSSLAINICRYIDPDFNVERIVYDDEDLRTNIGKNKPGDAVLVDEGALIFFSRDAMREDNKKSMRIFTALRSKNLFICICVPSLFILDKYIREHRVKSLTKVTKRGRFQFFSKNRINRIEFDNKTKTYKYPEPNFVDSFPKIDDVTWKKYLEKKAGVISEQVGWLSPRQFAKRAKIHPNTVYNYLKDGTITGEHTVSGRWRISATELDLKKVV